MSPPSFDVYSRITMRSPGAREVSLAAGGLTGAVGAIVLLGWALDIGFLKSLLDEFVSMKANTAVCFVLIGVSIWSASESDRRPGRLVAACACAWAVAVFASLTLAQDAFRWNLGIDELIFLDPLPPGTLSHPGRMAPSTAIAFFLLGSSLLLTCRGRRRDLEAAQVLAGAAGFTGMLAMTGYFYGAHELYGIGPWTRMALHTATTMMLGALGVLALRPDVGVVSEVLSDRPGGYLARRLLPAAVGLPILIGWVYLFAESVGMAGPRLGTAILVYLFLVTPVVLIILMSVSLNRMDAERTKAEAALSKMKNIESLGTLAGGIAHDFNNILTVVLGNIALLKTEVRPGGDGGAFIAEAEEACKTASGLANQLLTFAKGGDPILGVVDLRPLIAQTAAFSTRGLNARCIVELGDAPLHARADRDQIFRVIQNLIINAAQAMSEGGEIVVRAAPVSLAVNEVPPLRAGRYIRVTVKDQGAGIAPENLARVFDPYFSTKASGRGLGLAVCYSIMAKHGGAIGVESSPGSGALFTLHLPVGSGAALQAKTDRPAPQAGAGKVLVMDDEAAVARILARLLGNIGFESDSVADGAAVLDAYAAATKTGRPYDAVILDLEVAGGMGGKEAIGRLLALYPDAKVVVSSGYSSDPVVSDYAAHGFRAKLSKPYRIEEVAEALRRAGVQ